MIPLVTVGRLDPCVLLAFDTPADQVRPLVPAPLLPVERDGRSFWNIVVCRVDKMRPIGLPRALGLSYVHVAYRILVRCEIESGEMLQGLYFVRSDVDRSIVSVPGNRTSDFRFHLSKVDLRYDAQHVEAVVRTHDGFDASMCVEVDEKISTPPDPMLKYRPLGLACDPGGNVVRLAEVFRNESDWHETPVKVTRGTFQFFDTMRQTVRLVGATRVRPIDYRWRLGRVSRVASPRID